MQEQPANQQPDAEAGLVTLQIQLRPEHLRQIQRLAAREGATPEAFAALLLEEKLDEASRGG